MTTVPEPSDPLNQLLNGRPVPFVPVAPVYETLGPLQFHWMALRWSKWRARLDQAGTDVLPVDHQTYLDLELEIQTDTLDQYYPPPAWFGLPRNLTAAQVAGCAVARRREHLFWLSPNGSAEWIPPNRQAYHEALSAEKAHPYAHLWERGHHRDALLAALKRPAHQPPSPPEPTAEQVQAVCDSGRYHLARALLHRYPGSLPLYWYDSSPYNSLLGELGFQDMMLSLAERSNTVHLLLQHNLPRPSAELAAAQHLGVGIVFIEECLASADVISPRMYQEFVYPYTSRTLQFYEDRGFRTVLYFSGNLMPFLRYLKDLPFTALSFEEDRKNYGIDLAEVRRAMGPDRVLFGNLDAHFVEKASEQEVLAEVRRQVEVAGRHGNFIVSLGSPFTPDTSLTRVRLVCESTRLL